MHVLTIPHVGTYEVDVWESGAGRPLVYLHGFERHPGGASFLKRLAEDRRVLAPELPGYGSSTGFEHFRDIHDVALFHRELLRSLDVEQVDLIGHSLGGMFAAELAALAPELVRSLVLVDPFGLWDNDEPAPDPFGERSAVASALWHGDRPAQEPTNLPGSADKEEAILFSARNLGTASKFMWPIAERGLRRRLPYVQAPTLVVRGASDGLVPASYAEAFATLVPNGRTVTIPEAGHYPMIEQEDAFLQAVGDFLAGPVPAEAGKESA